MTCPSFVAVLYVFWTPTKVPIWMRYLTAVCLSGSDMSSLTYLPGHGSATSCLCRCICHSQIPNASTCACAENTSVAALVSIRVDEVTRERRNMLFRACGDCIVSLSVSRGLSWSVDLARRSTCCTSAISRPVEQYLAGL